MTTDPPPRRNWHLCRWLIVLLVAALAWSGWRAHSFRSALKQAEAIGWTMEYTDPAEEIWTDWNAAFKKETWLDGVTLVIIPTSEEFEQHLPIVHRLNPQELRIDNAPTLRDLSGLKPLDRLQNIGLAGCMGLTNVDALEKLSALQIVWLTDCTELKNVTAFKNLTALQKVTLFRCTGLTNLDGLKNLPALREVELGGCTGLTNVDALKELSYLKWIWLDGCTALTPESVAALKAALPNAKIFGP